MSISAWLEYNEDSGERDGFLTTEGRVKKKKRMYCLFQLERGVAKEGDNDAYFTPAVRAVSSRRHRLVGHVRDATRCVNPPDITDSTVCDRLQVCNYMCVCVFVCKCESRGTAGLFVGLGACVCILRCVFVWLLACQFFLAAVKAEWCDFPL